MSLLASLVATLLIAIGAWLGLRRRYWFACAAVLVALVPLLASVNIAKAVFVWLGLIGPIVMIVVIWHGLTTKTVP